VNPGTPEPPRPDTPFENAQRDVRGLRVLAFCDYFGTDSCGGAERVATEVYRRLAAWGAEVTVIAATPPGRASAPELPGVQHIAVPGVDLSRRLGAQVVISRKLLGETFRAGSRVRPHVLHTHSLHFQGSLAAAVWQRARGVPLVTTAHIGGLDDLAPAVRTATALYERTAGRFVLRRSQRAVAVSASVAGHLERLGMPLERITVVQNGVDHDRFHPGVPPSSTAPPLVLFVGRLIANKGPDVLVEALTILSDKGVAFRAELIGDGPMKSDLQSIVRHRRLGPRVSFAGALEDVAERFRQAAVLVRPSFSEGMPLVLLEAMATSVCVIASDIPGNSDLVAHGTNGMLFEAGNAHRLAERLREVLEDGALRQRLASAGLRDSLAHSWDVCASAYGAILAGTAVNRGQPPALLPMRAKVGSVKVMP